MSDLAKLGFQVDTTGLKKGEKALDSFAKTGESTEKRTDKSSKKIIDDMQGIEKAVGRTAAAQLKLDKATAQFSRRSGQAGIQFQQFIGQVQGGQGVMLALSQQSADLGFVLGAPLLGAIAGISASLIGLLLPSLLQTKDAAELLEGIGKELGVSLEESADGVDVLSQSLLKLAEKSEVLAKLQISASIQDAEKLITTSAEGIEQALDDAFGMTTESILRGFSESVRHAAINSTGSMEDVVKALATGKTALLGFGGGASGIEDTVRIIANQFKITKEEAVGLALSISDIFEDQSVFNIKKFESTLADLNLSVGGSNKEINKLAKTLIPLFDATTDGVNKVNLLREAFANFGKKANEADEDLIKFNNNVEKISSSLEAQIIALRDGEDAAISWSIAQRLGLESVEAIPEAIQAQIAEIKALKIAREEELKLTRKIKEEEKLLAAQQKKDKSDAEKRRKKEIRDFDKLTKQIEGFGGAWTKTGSVIVDAFGDISDAMNNYMSQLSEIESNEKDLAEFRKQKGEDNLEVIALQNKLESDRVSAELSGIKALSKAGASLFDEKTAAAKAFAALNKIITVAEIALSFQKMIAKTNETAVIETNNGIQQSSNALTAITAAFSAPFPVGFVAGAAMIGIMASLLGGFFGGGGSSVDMTEQRQSSQGTGTVLGSDEKSQSIIESQERFEDIQIDQLSELRGIRDSLNDVASGIALVTRDLIASRGLGEFGGNLTGSRAGESSLGKIFSGEILGLDFGGLGEKFITGLFGSTKKKVTDSGIQFIAQSLGEILEGGIVQASQFFDIKKTKKKLFGLSKKVTTSTEFQDLDSSFGEGIGAIFKNIGDVVLQSAKLLGFETVSILQSTLMGPLTAEDWAEFELGLAGRFAETFKLTEVTLEEALSNFQIDIGKVSLEGLSGEEIEKELQAIFSQQADLIAEFLVPSIAEYQKIGEGLFDTLTRVAQEQVIFNDNIKRMGIDLSELSNVMQIDVAQAIIGLTGGLENFSDLSNSFIEEFFTDAEKFAMLETAISEVFDSLGLSMVDSKEEFRALVEGIDLTTESGQELFAVLLEISPAFAEYINQLEDQADAMVDLSGAAEDAFSMLEKAVQLDKQRAAASFDIAREAHNNEINRINNLRVSLESENELRKLALSNSESALIKSFNLANQSIEVEKQRARAVLDVSSEILNTELSRINSLRISLNDEKRVREINVSNAEKILKASFEFEINLIKDNASKRIKSLKDFSIKEIDLIQNNADLRINNLEKERSALDGTASSMRSLVDRINDSLGLSGSSNLILALSNALMGDFSEAEKLDIGSLINLDPKGFSSAEDLAVQEAINRNRLASISGLAGTKLSESEVMISAIERQILATEEQSQNQILAIEKRSESEILAIEKKSELEVLELENQLNLLLGINTSILTISDAVNNLNASQIKLDELNYEQQQQQFNEIIVIAKNSFSIDEQGYKDELERLDLLIVDNENQLNSLLGIDTSVLSVEEAITKFKESQQELDNLNFDMEIANLDMLVESANEVLALHEQGYIDELERLDAILSDNEALLDAALGINNSVLSVADAIIALNDSIIELNEEEIPEPTIKIGKGQDEPFIHPPKPIEDLVEENKRMNDEMLILQKEIVKNTKSTARILQRFEYDGIDTRPIS